MKITVISTDREPVPPTYGGAIGRYIFDLARELVKRGHKVTIIGIPNIRTDYRSLGINFIPIVKSDRKNAFQRVLGDNINIIPNSISLMRIKNLLESSEIVQAHYFTTWALLPWLCKTPLLIQVWHNVPKPNIINKILARNFDLIIGVSKFIARKITSNLNVEANKVTVIYDFVNTDTFKYDKELREFYRKKLNLNNDDIALLYVGRIIPEKGLHYMLVTLHMLKKKYKKLKLLIVGPEGQFDKIETVYPTFIRQLIVKLKLEKDIIWLRNVSFKELLGIYNATDIVGIPTTMEEGGVLLVTLEAMASQKPIVAFNSGAISEALDHMRTGLLVPKGDIRAFSKAIELLISDERLRLRLAINARRFCEEKFSVKTAVDGLLKLYKRYLI